MNDWVNDWKTENDRLVEILSAYLSLLLEIHCSFSQPLKNQKDFCSFTYEGEVG